jgi:hypothetical protein
VSNSDQSIGRYANSRLLYLAFLRRDYLFEPELAVLAALTVNILQATYALQFPPATPPPPTPATPRPSPMDIAARSPKGAAGLGQSQRKLLASTPTVRV